MKICKHGHGEYEGTRCAVCRAECKALYRIDNPDSRVGESARRWKNRREFVQNSNATYRAENTQSITANKAAYYRANTDKVKQAAVQWSHTNPDRRREISYKFYELHPGYSRAYWQNRRAREKKVGGKLSKDLAERLMLAQNGKCACCGATLDTGYHLDHIKPIAKGGANEDWNIQLLTPRCNQKKGAKWLPI